MPMRLWTLHAQYLDARGLVALWREALLARAVLRGETRGYRHHPQLIRFQAHADPLVAIETYLWGVYDESLKRGYSFDAAKLGERSRRLRIRVTTGQLRYELKHLRNKLKERDKAQFRKLISVEEPEAHPLFSVVAGGIERWERTE